MSQNQCGCGGKGPLPEVTFSTFVLSLASAALVHLGEVADPETGQTGQQPELARHSISMLEMLHEKTTKWNYVGISRSKARLRRAFEDMRDLVRHIHDFYKGTRISKPLVDLFHGSQTAYVITQAAMRNKNSIGCHHRVD